LKPIPEKFITFDKRELEERILELKDLLFHREYYKKLDRVYYNCLAILDIYTLLLEHTTSDEFTKEVLAQLLFTYGKKGV
jgi:hypothetical protein